MDHPPSATRHPDAHPENINGFADGVGRFLAARPKMVAAPRVADVCCWGPGPGGRIRCWRGRTGLLECVGSRTPGPLSVRGEGRFRGQGLPARTHLLRAGRGRPSGPGAGVSACPRGRGTGRFWTGGRPDAIDRTGWRNGVCPGTLLVGPKNPGIAALSRVT